MLHAGLPTQYAYLGRWDKQRSASEKAPFVNGVLKLRLDAKGDDAVVGQISHGPGALAERRSSCPPSPTPRTARVSTASWRCLRHLLRLVL